MTDFDVCLVPPWVFAVGVRPNARLHEATVKHASVRLELGRTPKATCRLVTQRGNSKRRSLVTDLAPGSNKPRLHALGYLLVQ